MDEFAFKDHTRKFGLAAIKLVQALPRDRIADVLGRQLLRSVTAVGANYRSAWRGRSVADVVSRLSIVEEEADEAIYWIELMVESGAIAIDHARSLISEGNEIVAMTVASIKTLRKRMVANESQNPPLNASAQLHNVRIQNPKSKIQN